VSSRRHTPQIRLGRRAVRRRRRSHHHHGLCGYAFADLPWSACIVYIDRSAVERQAASAARVAHKQAPLHLELRMAIVPSF
jgi:hypothetical protein